VTVLESLALLNLIAVVYQWLAIDKQIIIAISLAACAATAKYGCFVRRHQRNDKEITDPPLKDRHFFRF